MQLQPGEVLLGKYRIEEYIDHGSFGEVYRAEHSNLHIPRALKILRKGTPGVSSQDIASAQERFDFEAQLGAHLDDTHVIRIYDRETSEGEAVLVMEYAPRKSLQDRLEKSGPLPLDDAVRLAIDLCLGLEAIHGKLKAVHRDLKPSNILFGEDGTAKIVDLGLAQVKGDQSRRTLLGSLAGWHPGTPFYMSPEQGTSKDYLLPTSDIFSLGCVLFEALTGEPYKDNYGSLVRDLRSDVPAWMDMIIARALAEEPGKVPSDDDDPKKRYRQARLMRDALEQEWQGAVQQRDAARKAEQEAEDIAIRDREEHARKIVQLFTAAELAIGRRDWAPANDLRSQLSKLGPDGFLAAEKLSDRIVNAQRLESERIQKAADEQARQKVKEEREQRESEIDALFASGQKAIHEGLWEEANFIVGQLSSQGEERARAAAATLRQLIEQTLQEEIKRLEALAKRAISGQDRRGALLAISQLEDLGPDGREAAEGLRKKLPALRKIPWWQETSPVVWLGAAVAAGLIILTLLRAALSAIAPATSFAVSPEITEPRAAVSKATPTAPAATSPEITDATGAQMVVIPAGEFSMGSSTGFQDETPVHRVILPAYYIDKYEVTNAQYQACVASAKCEPPAYSFSSTRASYYGNAEFQNFPVTSVDWQKSQTFCQWRNARLPTEAEWEKAARGTDGRTYPWGEGIDCRRANYDGCVGDTVAVGSYEAGKSIYGAYDLAGNVSEWIADWYAAYYYTTLTAGAMDPLGPGSGTSKGLRGGSWNDQAGMARSSNRGSGDPIWHFVVQGFRCVRSAP